MDSKELCRLCATEKDTFVDGFVRIYSDEGQKFGLEKKIIRCLQIELCSADALPKSVCLECCSKLHQCADFVESSARAQNRLKILVEHTAKLNELSASASKEGAKEEIADKDAETIIPDKVEELDNAKQNDKNNEEKQHLEHQQLKPQTSAEKVVCSSKFLKCVVNEENSRVESSPKEQVAVPEIPRSRASKRKCRLPVRVSRVCLEDEIDLENVGLDAAEISKIFADDDSDDEIRRKKKSRKKRASVKVKTRAKPKPKSKKCVERHDKRNEDSHVLEDNGKENSKKTSENGSKNTDSDYVDDNGFGDDDNGDDDDVTNEKSRNKGNSKEKRKGSDIDLSYYAWTCSDCSQELGSIDELRLHHSDVHKQSPRYMCNVCSKVVTLYSGFLSHIRRHQENDRYCKKGLDSHRVIHSDKRPHVCSVCGKAFRQQSALQVHSRCHLPDELKNKYACDECDKRFSTKPNLVTHKRIHTGIRNYTCDQCGKSFVQKGNLDAHLLTHSTAKPFSCQSCEKSFKTELQLRKHGSIHTGVKPHQCDVCGRQFRERGTLREHHRIHTGAMPFTCEFCGKTFRFKGVLTTHRRQHTGERPYSCVECQHHFTNWPNYNKHMKRRHGVNTSRQSRPTVVEHQQPATEIVPNPLPIQPPCLSPDPLEAHPPQPEITIVQSSESQLQQQPTALIQKADIDHPQPHPIYIHENTMSQHSVHSQEEDSMSSHHEMYSAPAVHSPHSTHHAVSHALHLGHSSLPVHAHIGLDEERESKYATEREILLGQMARERERTHFYNPAPGSSVNTNPYLHQSLHQSLHHSLQQTQIPIPGLYGIPQLSLDPSHLEILHSSASQHR
ncbi:Zinc finger protein 235 [Frankliniella fusca]|uniref:Zinc finger protein 235 n=1 Tax=Frankliniella fusca TaxID=407009 RepID=A0AAE1HT04_9NEOP|nr:Zinc finger protein 235 [Frankliniella fusca]